MIKALLVGDGKHEGSGALEALVRMVIATEITFDYKKVNELRAYHGTGPGYYKKALGWMGIAEKRGFDALILVIDEDDKRERVRQITNAQDHGLARMPRALGVAIRTFDAWMLADEQALSEVLGSVVQRQRDPEKIKDPKNVFRSLRDASASTAPAAALYAELACRLNIKALETRCPKGFAPFAQRVRELQPSENHSGAPAEL